jgi:LDH2 family malate/lactate/ureidoglycolate dehydrogenase
VLARRVRIQNDFYSGGALLPAAGYKGFGLGAPWRPWAVSLTGVDGQGATPTTGAIVICIGANAFRPAAEVAASVEALRQRLRASGQGSDALAPGDFEARSRNSFRRVVVSDEVMALIHQPASQGHAVG